MSDPGFLGISDEAWAIIIVLISIALVVFNVGSGGDIPTR